MKRKFYYYIQIFPLIIGIKNWYEIILMYLFRNGEKVIYLRNGGIFKIHHYLDALTVKEIFIDDDYNIKLKNPKVIIDIGANIGTFSILQAQKFPKSKIFAFEPALKTFELLKTNISLNNIENIKAENIGIWRKKGETVFFSNSASGLSSLFNNLKRSNVKKVKVKLDSLKSIFIKNNIKNCDLMKIDCEGAEYEILLNLEQDILKKIKNFAIEYHDLLTEHNHQELIYFLKTNKYKVSVRKHTLEKEIGIIYAKK